jgi:hypothetical protein
MIFCFKFIEETPLARHYESKKIGRFWIPRTIVKHTTKHPEGMHEIDLPEWKATELGLMKAGVKI